MDNLQSHICGLEALKITGEQYGMVLTPLILSRLPSELRLEWARIGEGHEGDLSFLLELLQAEVLRRELSPTYKEPTSDNKTVLGESRTKVATSQRTLHRFAYLIVQIILCFYS